MNLNLSRRKPEHLNFFRPAYLFNQLDKTPNSSWLNYPILANSILPFHLEFGSCVGSDTRIDTIANMDAFAVMHNHVHGILVLFDPGGEPSIHIQDLSRRDESRIRPLGLGIHQGQGDHKNRPFRDTDIEIRLDIMGPQGL